MPVHASQMSRIEIWLSNLRRRVTCYGSFEDGAALRAAVLGFVGHSNDRLARPFRRTFSGRFEDTARAA